MMGGWAGAQVRDMDGCNVKSPLPDKASVLARGEEGMDTLLVCSTIPFTVTFTKADIYDLTVYVGSRVVAGWPRQGECPG